MTGLWTEYITIIAVNIALLLALSAVLYGLWWIPRENYRRYKHGADPYPYNWLRGLIFFASLSLFIKLGLLMFVLLDIASLRQPTPASVAFTVMSVVFALLAVTSLLGSIYGMRGSAPAYLRWHSLLVSLALTAMAGVLMYQRLVAVRLWTI